MDTRLVIQDLEFLGQCGISEEERQHAQPIRIDLEATLALPPPSSDTLSQTVDYMTVAGRIIQLGTSREFHLLETLAAHVSDRLLSEFPIARISLWIRKGSPLLPNLQGSVGIRTVRDRVSPGSTPLPAHFLQEILHRLPHGTALDVASGSGRNALYLAAHGYHVDAVDKDMQALGTLQAMARDRGLPQISVRQIDMETDDTPPDFDDGRYDLILVFFYLYRPLFPALLRALKPGGVLVYETFLLDNHLQRGHPRRREFCLAPNELFQLTPGMRVLHYDEGEHVEPHGEGGAFTARLMARKEGSS